MLPDLLAREIQSFLEESPRAVLIEDGQPIFDLSCSRLSLNTERSKCLLHVWSEERNIVRRILEAERKNGVLRLKVQKFGAPKPHTVELVSDRDQRSPSAKRAQRTAYQRLLTRILAREFPGATIEKLSTAADLERSFGPVHARGLVKKGSTATAVIGVNAAEDQTSVDSLLTTAILWLHECRERVGHKMLVEGVRLYAPAGRSAVLQARMAHLNHAAAKFELSEVEEKDELVDRRDVCDAGNLFTRLARHPDPATLESRFADAIAKVLAIVPEAEINIHSATQIAFRFRGLDFARARNSLAPRSFQQQLQLTFGAGPFETPLNEESEPLFRDLMQRVQQSRTFAGNNSDALYRMQPERWLESVLRRDVTVVDSSFDPQCVYSQVPAFAASDRAMIDLLTVTRSGRLAVLELKANEDLHLPLQGLDYWSRVNWHHQRREFRQFGYFAGHELSSEPPLLYLVCPALRLHPATDTLLRYLSSRIDVTVVGINEGWRKGVEVVFRKRRADVLRAKA